MDKLPNEHLLPEAFGNEILTSGINSEDITSQTTLEVARFLKIINRENTFWGQNSTNLATTKGKLEC